MYPIDLHHIPAKGRGGHCSADCLYTEGLAIAIIMIIANIIARAIGPSLNQKLSLGDQNQGVVPDPPLGQKRKHWSQSLLLLLPLVEQACNRRSR